VRSISPLRRVRTACRKSRRCRWRPPGASHAVDEIFGSLGQIVIHDTRRRPAPGLVHHSDRGSQYASGDHTDLLEAHGCQISMSQKASPWENAGCESWMKTLKAEGVYRQDMPWRECAAVGI